MIAAEISSLLTHGTDTIAIALATAVWDIYTAPKILENLRDDLEFVDDEQLLKRPYLDAVIRESLRLSSPVSRRLPPVVPKNKDIFYEEDKHHDGWHKILPAGSIVGISAYSCHRHPVFHHSESFVPERWLSATREMHDSFIPFGKGKRACVGREVVQLIMSYSIKAVVENFDAEVIGSAPKYQEAFHTTIHGDQVKLKLHKRL